MSLTQFRNNDQPFQLMQTSWANQLNPLLSNPSLQCSILQNIALVSGQTNTINHLLGRTLQGWRLIRVRGQATIWDTQDSNTNPSQTLLLHTSNNVTVNLEVF